MVYFFFQKKGKIAWFEDFCVRYYFISYRKLPETSEVKVIFVPSSFTFYVPP